mgnify:CR=1 FL=1
MASIKQLDDRRFKITVSNGYRPDGKKICKAKTIRVPESIPKRGIRQYVAHEAEELERQFKTGYSEDGNMTFQEFAERWLARQVRYAPSTLESYRRMLGRAYPFIGAIPCALLILLVSPLKCLYFVIFIFVLQQFDGNILGPKILGDSTGLASFWVLFSILLFGGLFGFVGMVLGVPVFAMFYSVVNRLVRYGLGKRKLPVETQEYLGRTGPLSRPKE